MIDKDMLEAIGQLLEPIKQDLAEVKQRVTKIEVTQEQITNKNIQLLMEGQHDVNEKLKQLDAVSAAVEDIQITVNAMEAVTKQNCTDIKQLRLAKQLKGNPNFCSDNACQSPPTKTKANIFIVCYGVFAVVKEIADKV